MRKITLFLVALVLVALVTPVVAEVITLKDGSVLMGKILEGDEKGNAPFGIPICSLFPPAFRGNFSSAARAWPEVISTAPISPQSDSSPIRSAKNPMPASTAPAICAAGYRTVT